jgi:hypothetical protein
LYIGIDGTFVLGVREEVFFTSIDFAARFILAEW